MSSLHITADSIQTSPALSFPNSTKLVITSSGISSNNGGSVSLITPNSLIINNQGILSKDGANLAPISDASTAYNQGIIISGDVSGVAPGAPVINNATNGNFGEVTIDFTLSSLDSGSSITSLTFYAYINGVLSLTQTTSTLTSPYTFTGVNFGTTYTFKMSETNATGEGALSAASNAVDIPYPANIQSVAFDSSYPNYSSGTTLILTVTIDAPAQGNIPITITPSDPLLICYDITGSTLIIPEGQTYAQTPVFFGFFDGATHTGVYITASVGISSMSTTPTDLITNTVSVNLPSLIPYGNNATGTIGLGIQFVSGTVQWNLSLSDNTLASLDVNSVNLYSYAYSSDPFTITAFTLDSPQTLTVYASPSLQPSYIASGTTTITDYIPPVLSSLDINCSYSDVEYGGNWLGYSQGFYGNMSENTTLTGTIDLSDVVQVDTAVIITPSSYDSSVDPLNYLTFPDAVDNGDGTFTVTVLSGQSSVNFTVVGAAGNFPSTNFFDMYFATGVLASYPFLITASTAGSADVTFDLYYNPQILTAYGAAVTSSPFSVPTAGYANMSSKLTQRPLSNMLLLIKKGADVYIGNFRSGDVPYAATNQPSAVQLSSDTVNLSTGLIPYVLQLSSPDGYQVSTSETMVPWVDNGTSGTFPYRAGYFMSIGNGSTLRMNNYIGSSNYDNYITYNETENAYVPTSGYSMSFKWYGGGY